MQPSRINGRIVFLAGVVIALFDLWKILVVVVSTCEGLALDFAPSQHDLAVAMTDSSLDSGSG